MKWIDLAREQLEYMVEARRYLHQNPEISMEEVGTTQYIAQQLNEMGIPYRLLKPTGVVAEIRGGRPGKTIALRADMDALRMTECTGLAYASQNQGVMHACGHDGHMAGLLGAAKLLQRQATTLGGSVRLIFQPGEEVGQGAKAAVAQGAMDGVDGVFSMHNMPQMPVGAIAGSVGPVFSAADKFVITIKGQAAHGATPEAGVDATVVAAALVMNLQPLVSREVSSLDALVITVGQLHSGTRFNIISGEAVLEGTVRCFDPALHAKVPEALERVAGHIAAAHRAQVQVEITSIAKACVNDPAMTELCLQAAGKVVGDPQLILPEGRHMLAEDFSEYMQLAPGAFFLYGVGGQHPLHSDYYTLEENALATAAAMYAQVASDFLASL